MFCSSSHARTFPQSGSHGCGHHFPQASCCAHYFQVSFSSIVWQLKLDTCRPSIMLCFSFFNPSDSIMTSINMHLNTSQEYRWGKNTGYPNYAVTHSYYSSFPDPKPLSGSHLLSQEPKTCLPVSFRTQQQQLILAFSVSCTNTQKAMTSL